MGSFGTGYGFSSRLTPFFFAVREAFRDQVVRTAYFYEIPQPIFSLYLLAARKEEFRSLLCLPLRRLWARTTTARGK